MYDIVHFSAYGKDPMLPLAQECRKQGIKFCTYYSILDWHHASQTVNGNGDAATTMKTDQKDIYITQMKEQLQELITKYDTELLWFDGEWSDWWTSADGQSLYKFVRTLKPSLIVNNRVGKRAVTDGDFGTPEGAIPSGGLPYDWESCMTMNGTWGYSTYATGWVTPADQIHDLIDIASKGGNLLLNVGPTGQGIIPPESEAILAKVGNWLKVYGASIYGSTLSDYSNVKFGKVTAKGTDYFLHVWKTDASNIINFPMIADPNSIPEAFLLKDSTKLKVQITDKGLLIDLSGIARDPYSTVIVLKAKGTKYVGFLDAQADGSFVLTTDDVITVGSSLQVENTGNLGYWTDGADYAYWNLDVKHSGKYKVTLRYAHDPSAGIRRVYVQSDLNNAKITFIPVNTPGWQSYQDVVIDSLQLEAGKQKIKIGSDDGTGAWINLMKVTLTPGTTTRVENVESADFNLRILPTPVTDNSIIAFNLPTNSYVKMNVYNEQGKVVDELVDAEYQSGYHQIPWNKELGKGIYFVNLQSDNQNQTVKTIKE